MNLARNVSSSALMHLVKSSMRLPPTVEPISLTWINFNPGMDVQSYAQ